LLASRLPSRAAPTCNPHSARCLAGAQLPATSCLGAFWTPASSACRSFRRRRRPKTTTTADSRTATNSSVSDRLVGEQQDRFRDGEPERLARCFKPYIRNPVALAPAQAGLFILALEGCRRASEQRRFYILKCVDADDGVEAAVDSAGDHRHHATPGAHVKLGSLGAERVFFMRACDP